MLSSMFHLPLPILEKVLRPVIVYLFLIGFLRLFGKRELAQLNPFDLVVLLSLSNTVQNAIIGDDNSITGGVIGAFSLLAINWIRARLLFKMPRVNQALEGTRTELIRNGVVDDAALQRETLTREELLSVLHKQGMNDYSEAALCVLEPNGTFYTETRNPTLDQTHIAGLQTAIDALMLEVKTMRAELASR